jgi:hypothetical protein
MCKSEIERYAKVSRGISYDTLVELVRDIQNDKGLHNGAVFNSWKKRNNLRHVKIKDVSHLFQIDLDADPEESVIKFI